MALDEEALEAMLRRQNAAADGSPPPKAELTDETEEFEVYERPRPDEPAPEPVLEPMAEPVPEAVPTPASTEGAPPEPAEPRRPQVWPPISRSHAPEPVPAAPEQHVPVEEPAPTPPAPTPTPAPEAALAPEPTPQTTTPAGSCRIALVHCKFNAELTDRMAAFAQEHAAALGATITRHLTVPGVYDAPLAVQTLARRHDVDGVVVIGAVVTGDTRHDELITHATAHKLQDIACDTEKPVGLGITGPGQSWAEAEARVGNARNAVQAVVEQWRVLQTV